MGNECTKIRKSEKNPKMLRWYLINEECDIAQLNAPETGLNKQYNYMLKQIKESNRLNKDEKEAAEKNIAFMRDRENLIRLKEVTYTCKKCGKSGYTELFCEHCVRKYLKDNFSKCKSGNEIIDKAIQDAQINLPFPRYIIEWIPYTDFEKIEYKTKGGFATISTAIWKKGVIMSFNSEKQEFERGEPGIVILKNLSNGKNIDERFLKEIGTHISLSSKGYTVATCYGITRNPDTGDYILVLANYEQDLKSYIRNSYDKITWKETYQIFYNISEDIYNMHKDGLVHCDLHGGNILKSKGNLFQISDFGVSGPVNKERTLIYGMAPFIAPEVLKNKKYTTKSDIYSIGMLMYYVAVGQIPLECTGNQTLNLEILNGRRPPMPDGLPQNFQKVMKLCWDENPDKRPSAEDLYYFFLSEYEAESKNPTVKNVTFPDNITTNIFEGESTLFPTMPQKISEERIVYTSGLSKLEISDTYPSQCEDSATTCISFESTNPDATKKVDLPTNDNSDFFEQFRQNNKKPRLIKKGHLVTLGRPN
ncbi:protein kinase [Gigaspora margarita]|uniref:Protein kinase n=1 Tax=Gigaspora margarita TaxID=4874 RepID=A0A8H4A233_GIGMA|nr:protein kinase [Gigaspora margarita]